MRRRQKFAEIAAQQAIREAVAKRNLETPIEIDGEKYYAPPPHPPMGTPAPRRTRRKKSD